MNSAVRLMMRVAAPVPLCHKAHRFSAAHNIWRLDDY